MAVKMECVYVCVLSAINRWSLYLLCSWSYRVVQEADIWAMCWLFCSCTTKMQQFVLT